MQLSAELIRTVEELDAIKDGWQRLTLSQPDNTLVFTSWDYVRAYVSCLNPPGWLVIAIFEAGTGVPVAIYPLSIYNIEHAGGVSRACRPLGVPYFPYVDFPVRGDLCTELTRTLLIDILRDVAKVEIAFLGPLRMMSPTYVGVLESMEPAAMKVLSAVSYGQIETRSESFADYRRGRKYATVRDAERCERRLQELGRLEFCSPDRDCNLPAVTRTICDLNQQKFGDQHIHAGRGEWKDFLVDLIGHLAPSGLMEASTLRLDDKLIAGCLGFLHKGRYYYYIVSYDPAYAAYSPSKVLLVNLIKRAFREKLTFCFGGGTYSYKDDWCHCWGAARVPVIFLNPALRPFLEPALTLERLGDFIGRR